jgi:hypothetical protein
VFILVHSWFGVRSAHWSAYAWFWARRLGLTVALASDILALVGRMKSAEHNIKPYHVALVAFGIWCGIVALMVFEDQGKRKAAPEPARKAGQTKAAPASNSVSDLSLMIERLQATGAENSAPAAADARQAEGHPKTAGQVPRRPEAAVASATTPGGSQKPSPQDPLARLALSQVGADLEAEAYWYEAINDPTLPAQERQDLIEDLNEDGLSNPRRPSAEDMPLILSRLRLLEELAPYAMDDVNADAFAEAYKDLIGLLNGQPPQ